MASKLVAAVAITGPDGQSSWWDAGEAFTWQAAVTAATTYVLFPVQTVPQPDTQLAGGLPVTETLTASGGAASANLPMARLNGASVSMLALLAAHTTLILGVQVVRCIDTLGAQIAAASGALTSIPLTAPLTTPLAEDQTFVLTNAAGTAQTWTVAGPTGAGMPAGSTYIGVDSQTPSATYTTNTPLVYLAGNTLAFGWIGTGSAGTGTPVLPAGRAMVMPAIAANLAIVTPGASGSYLNLFPGDMVEAVFGTSSSTVSVTVGTIQTFIV